MISYNEYGEVYNDPHNIANIINICINFADNKSIVSLLANLDAKKLEKPDVRFEVPFKTLI